MRRAMRLCSAHNAQLQLHMTGSSWLAQRLYGRSMDTGNKLWRTCMAGYGVAMY